MVSDHMKYSTIQQQNYGIKQNVSECWASKSRKICVPKARSHSAPKTVQHFTYKRFLLKNK